MMGDIYVNSERVLIWLGEADSTTEVALDGITKFGTAIGGWKFDMTADLTATKFNDQVFYDELGIGDLHLLSVEGNCGLLWMRMV
jgi:hypothetical protein